MASTEMGLVIFAMLICPLFEDDDDDDDYDYDADDDDDDDDDADDDLVKGGACLLCNAHLSSNMDLLLPPP